MKNNIFMYSPAELTTDAFLAWYIKEFDENHAIQDQATPLFHSLGLCESPSDSISNIRVYRQEQNTDLIIRYLVNGNEVQALFENKTYTSTHSDQLKRYANSFPKFKYFKYLKLGYITYAERKEAKEANYDVIDVYRLKAALDSVLMSNMIIDQYRDFLDTHFIRAQDEITSCLVKYNNYHLFEWGQAQQYILSELHRQINGLNPNLYFKHAANSGGSPWTQLDIARRHQAYGDKSEYLFWRIDRRGKGYYLRLNQYSNITNNYWPQKGANLEILRDRIAPLLETKGLVLGKTVNKGTKESEIVILFFVDNYLTEITKHLPALSKEIYHFYSSFNGWA